MQINPNSPVRPALRTAANPPAVQHLHTESEPVEFSQVTALDQALKQAPDVRTNQVDRARELVGDVNYPPRETLRRIAQLLAISADGEAE